MRPLKAVPEQVGVGTQAVRRERDGLGVVSGARGGHSGIQLRLREASELVKGAAQLEGSGALQALRLHGHGAPDPP
jgi:hypothetical protein